MLLVKGSTGFSYQLLTTGIIFRSLTQVVPLPLLRESATKPGRFPTSSLKSRGKHDCILCTGAGWSWPEPIILAGAGATQKSGGSATLLVL